MVIFDPPGPRAPQGTSTLLILLKTPRAALRFSRLMLAPNPASSVIHPGPRLVLRLSVFTLPIAPFSEGLWLSW